MARPVCDRPRALVFEPADAVGGAAIVVTFRPGTEPSLFHRLAVIKIRKSEYQIRSIDYFVIQGYTA